MGCDYAHAEYVCQAYALTAMADMSNEHENLFMDTKTALGKAIAQLRKSAKLNQIQLGDLAGTDQGAISKIETGKQDVTTATLSGIANSLGVPISTIWSVAEDIMGKGAPMVVGRKSSPTPKKKRIMSPADQIDALAEAVGAIAVALAKTRSAEGAKILAELREVDPQYLAEDGLIPALIEAVESAIHEAKDRKTPRRGGS